MTILKTNLTCIRIFLRFFPFFLYVLRGTCRNTFDDRSKLALYQHSFLDLSPVPNPQAEPTAIAPYTNWDPFQCTCTQITRTYFWKKTIMNLVLIIERLFFFLKFYLMVRFCTHFLYGHMALWNGGINCCLDCISKIRRIVLQPGLRRRNRALYFSARNSCNLSSGW